MSIGKFWMVWVVGRPGPQHRHHSIESARTQATRLAGERTESPVVVLEVVAVAQKAKPPVEWGSVDYPVHPEFSADDDGKEILF